MGVLLLKAVKKSCVCVGMVVGAGFASGREITDYFLVFGNRWKAGTAAAGILFFLVFWAVTEIINKNGINTYREYLLTIMGEKTAIFTEWVSGLFFFAMFAAMTSASGTAAREMFGMKYALGAGLLLAVCAAVMLKGMGAVEGISVMLVPLLIAGTAAVGACSRGEAAVIGGHGGSVLLSAVIYVSYNTICSASVLVQAEKSSKRTEGLLTGLLCGTAMTAMGLMIGNAVLQSGKEAVNAGLPFAYAAAKAGGFCNAAYIAVFLASVLTTAVCDGMAAADFLQKRFGMGKTRAVLALTTGAAALSAVSFEKFVTVIYPLFGLAGILQLICTLTYFFKIKKSGY